jgi:hypothetical protein
MRLGKVVWVDYMRDVGAITPDLGLGGNGLAHSVRIELAHKLGLIRLRDYPALTKLKGGAHHTR